MATNVNKKLRGLCKIQRKKVVARAAVILGEEIQTHPARPGISDFKPFVLSEPLTDAFIKQARKEGRK